jgi:hypothetical protein
MKKLRNRRLRHRRLARRNRYRTPSPSSPNPAARAALNRRTVALLPYLRRLRLGAVTNIRNGIAVGVDLDFVKRSGAKALR